MTKTLRVVANFVVALLILSFGLTLFGSVKEVEAGVNGQQLRFTCYQAQGPIEFYGPNQSGQYVTLTIQNGTWNGLQYTTWGWWWKGEFASPTV